MRPDYKKLFEMACKELGYGLCPQDLSQCGQSKIKDCQKCWQEYFKDKLKEGEG